MRFEVGQSAWMASCNSSNNRAICPDCNGDGRLRVTFADETTVSIECRNCCSGYDPPTGFVTVYEWSPHARPCTITGYEVAGEQVRWRTSESYIVDDEDLFVEHADCMARSKEKCEQHNAAERARILMKEKDTRTWAWNASYHRRCIERAKKDIEYHTAKLAVASLKAKEAKAA